jgi:hypothetical protein
VAFSAFDNLAAQATGPLAALQMPQHLQAIPDEPDLLIA